MTFFEAVSHLMPVISFVVLGLIIFIINRFSHSRKETKSDVKVETEDERNEKINKVKGLLRVHGIWLTYRSGITFANYDFSNMSEKVIKYITFTLEGFNAVGDAQSCYGHDGCYSSCTVVRFTGPIAHGARISGQTSEYWLSDTVTTVQLFSIFIEYMDGTATRISNKYASYTIY